MQKESGYIEIIMLISSTILLLLPVIFIIIFTILYQKKRAYFLSQLEAIKSANKKELLIAQLEIQEKTFDKISQEIHDNIGQVLSLVRLNLNTFDNIITEEKLNHTDLLLGKAIKDLRDLSHNLQSNRIHNIGIIESIRQLLSSLEKTGRFKTSFTTSDNFHILDNNTDVILYRMIQEIVNNIIKHAAANSISVNIDCEDEISIISISDNGIGFDTTLLKEERPGIGLQNIINRAKMINTTVDVKSSPGNGTTITLYIKPKLAVI